MSKFFGCACVALFVIAFAGAVNAQTQLDGFESGTWVYKPWAVAQSGGSISATVAHSGSRSLQDPGWTYRTDVTLGGVTGHKLSCWVYPGASARTYMGFGATSAGCYSLTLASNTSQLCVMNSSSWGYTIVASTSYTFTLSQWYKLEVEWTSSTNITGRVYDSTGKTVLVTVNYNLPSVMSGGVAIRSFSSNYVDDFEYVKGPALSTSVNSLNLGTTAQGTAGTPQSYTVSGSQLTSGTTITPPSGVEISFSQTSGYVGSKGSLSITSTGSWGPTTIWARIEAAATAGTISGDIAHVSSGATTVNVSVSGNVTGPTITTSTTSLALGSTYETFAGAAVTYTVTGSILTAQTVITAPANVEISETSATAGFGPTITVTATGNWGPKTVWARIKSTAPVGSISGNITHVSTGAGTKNVAVSGTVNAPSVVPSVSSLNLGLTSLGTASTEVSYTVNGNGTRADTTITAPTGVEVSLTQASGYSSSVAIKTTGSWGPTTIWARISASASAGAISGNITHATTGATTANVAVSGTVIELSVNPTSLNLGTTQQGFPGTVHSYTLIGNGLSGNTDITPPTGINVATAAAGPFLATLSLSGSSINQPIYVRLDGAAIGTWAGNITNTNQGVTVNVAVTGDVTNANDLMFTRNGPTSTTSVDNNAQGPGSNGLVVLDITATAGGQAWTLTDMTFTESGTADAQTDINFVALYEDSTTAGTPGTFDGPGTDTLATAAAGTSFSAPDGDYVATLSNSAFAAGTTRRFFLVVKLAGSASAGETIKVELNSTNATTGGSGAVSGVPTAGTVPAFDILPATLAVTLNGPMSYKTVNNTSQGTGGNGELLCDVTLTASNDAFTVTSMVFTASGTADEQADINFLALYVDNGNGTFDGPGTDTLATAAAGTSFNAPNGTYTATLTGAAGSIASGTSKRYFLVAKLAGTASSGENFKAALTTVNATSPSGGTVTGAPTAASSALVIDVPTLTVNAGTANPADASVEATSTAFTHTLGEISMTASNANFTISGVTLTLGGNGDWVNNITAVSVYQDDGSGTFDAADTQLFSGAASAGSITCGFSSNVTVPMGGTVDFWVVIDVAASAGASPAETFSAQIASAADVAQVTSGNVALGTMTPVSSTLSVIVFFITNFNPLQDAFSGGAPITIDGSGFGGTTTCTINGVPCTGTAVVNAGGTQITGLKVPGGSGTNLTIVLTTNNLGPRTLTQKFSYNFSLGGGVSGGGGSNNSTQGCAAQDGNGGIALLLAILGAMALVATLRLRRA